jgi:hypothetical protein
MQAQAYNRTKNFLENNPDRTDHGSINAELDNAAISINVLRDNAALLQDDDGGLKNSIVLLANLAAEVIEGLRGPQGTQGIQGPIGQGIQGIAGPTGNVGASFDADARDLFANRNLYDLQAKGFSVLAIDSGLMYFKLSATSADWSDGVQFGKGLTGTQGVIGLTGDTGSQGLQGIQGVQGVAGSAGNDGADGVITTIDTATKTASLIGRSSFSARLAVVDGQLTIVLTTA